MDHANTWENGVKKLKNTSSPKILFAGQFSGSINSGR